MVDQQYEVIGITDDEFFGTVGHDPSESIMRAVHAAFHESTRASMAEKRSRLVKTQMEVRIYDDFGEGRVPGFEPYITLLFLNDAAQSACQKAGLSLSSIGTRAADQLPLNTDLLVRLPLYS